MYKNELKIEQRPKRSAKTIKLSERNTGGKLCDIEYDTKSLDIKRKKLIN